MSEIAEFPVAAAATRLTAVAPLPPGGETDEIPDPVGRPDRDARFFCAHGTGNTDELLDVGDFAHDAQDHLAHVGKPEEITGRDHTSSDTLVISVLVGDACERLQELQVRRRFWIKAINRQDNALGALARRAMGWRYDMPETEREKMNGRAASLVSALLKGKAVKADDAEAASALAADVAAAQAAREPMIAQRAAIEKEMKRLAKTLPAAAWQAETRGFGEMGLAVIIGEAGDLSNYAGPAKLWRRLGLAPYQGHAGKTWRVPQWRERALSAEEWSEYGYSAQRLAQVYGVVTEPLIKACGGTVYRDVYDHAKASFADRARSPAHAHAHAMRVMTKALILDLWRVWHGMPPRERHLSEADLQGIHAALDTPQKMPHFAR